jgi:uroporphyrin-III C-methyltransferase
LEHLKILSDKAKEIPTPAIIVVGEVVKLREELKWFEE